MKIAYLGAGTWGFCLASLLCENGNTVTLWSPRKEFARSLAKTKKHPKLPNFTGHKDLHITSDLNEALQGAEMIVESVTSSGVRPVFEQVKAAGFPNCPIVITSKGIEQNSGLLLPEVVLEVLGQSHRDFIGCLSGPSHAEEVIRQLPTSVVCSGYGKQVIQQILDAFSTQFFRIYPNPDLNGVAFGGAMKNIVAIACGISDGLRFGSGAKAALMTRGLHEIRKLSVAKGCQAETLNGLSGLGDLCVTCMSTHSRNYSFGRLIAEGLSPDAAKEKIGMVVEGAYTCVSALQLAKKHNIAVPITQVIYMILYENLNPLDAVKKLLERPIKEEFL